MPHEPIDRARLASRLPLSDARPTLDELGPIADAIEQFAEAIRDHVPSNESEKRVDMERLSLNPAGLSHVLTCAVRLEHVLGPLRPATKATGQITPRFWPDPYRSSLRAALSAADRVFDRIVTRWNWQTAIGRHGFEGCAIGTDGHRYPDASQMSAPLEDLIVHATELDMLRRSASQLHAMARELGALDREAHAKADSGRLDQASPAGDGQGETATNLEAPATAPTSPIDYEFIIDRAGRDKKILFKNAVKFMRNRKSATFDEMIEHVHGREVKDATIRKLACDINNYLNTIGQGRLKFSTSGCVFHKEEPPE